MITIVIINSLISAIAQYIDKHLVNKGITRKDYFYYMCLSMIPFSAIMIVIETINGQSKFEFNIIPIALLIVAMFLRYNKQQAVQGSIKYLNPYEVSTYLSLRSNYCIFSGQYIRNKTVYNYNSSFNILNIIRCIYISRCKIENKTITKRFNSKNYV